MLVQVGKRKLWQAIVKVDGKEFASVQEFKTKELARKAMKEAMAEQFPNKEYEIIKLSRMKEDDVVEEDDDYVPPIS